MRDIELPLFEFCRTILNHSIFRSFLNQSNTESMKSTNMKLRFSSSMTLNLIKDITKHIIYIDQDEKVLPHLLVKHYASIVSRFSFRHHLIPDVEETVPCDSNQYVIAFVPSLPNQSPSSSSYSSNNNLKRKFCFDVGYPVSSPVSSELQSISSLSPIDRIPNSSHHYFSFVHKLVTIMFTLLEMQLIQANNMVHFLTQRDETSALETSIHDQIITVTINGLPIKLFKHTYFPLSFYPILTLLQQSTDMLHNSSRRGFNQPSSFRYIRQPQFSDLFTQTICNPICSNLYYRFTSPKSIMQDRVHEAHELQYRALIFITLLVAFGCSNSNDPNSISFQLFQQLWIGFYRFIYGCLQSFPNTCNCDHCKIVSPRPYVCVTRLTRYEKRLLLIISPMVWNIIKIRLIELVDLFIDSTIIKFYKANSNIRHTQQSKFNANEIYTSMKPSYAFYNIPQITPMKPFSLDTTSTSIQHTKYTTLSINQMKDRIINTTGDATILQQIDSFVDKVPNSNYQPERIVVLCFENQLASEIKQILVGSKLSTTSNSIFAFDHQVSSSDRCAFILIKPIVQARIRKNQVDYCLTEMKKKIGEGLIEQPRVPISLAFMYSVGHDFGAVDENYAPFDAARVFIRDNVIAPSIDSDGEGDSSVPPGIQSVFRSVMNVFYYSQCVFSNSDSVVVPMTMIKLTKRLILMPFARNRKYFIQSEFVVLFQTIHAFIMSIGQPNENEMLQSCTAMIEPSSNLQKYLEIPLLEAMDATDQDRVDHELIVPGFNILHMMNQLETLYTTDGFKKSIYVIVMFFYCLTPDLTINENVYNMIVVQPIKHAVAFQKKHNAAGPGAAVVNIAGGGSSIGTSSSSIVCQLGTFESVTDANSTCLNSYIHTQQPVNRTILTHVIFKVLNMMAGEEIPDTIATIVNGNCEKYVFNTSYSLSNDALGSEMHCNIIHHAPLCQTSHVISPAILSVLTNDTNKLPIGMANKFKNMIYNTKIDTTTTTTSTTTTSSTSTKNSKPSPPVNHIELYTNISSDSDSDSEGHDRIIDHPSGMKVNITKLKRAFSSPKKKKSKPITSTSTVSSNVIQPSPTSSTVLFVEEEEVMEEGQIGREEGNEQKSISLQLDQLQMEQNVNESRIELGVHTSIVDAITATVAVVKNLVSSEYNHQTDEEVTTINTTTTTTENDEIEVDESELDGVTEEVNEDELDGVTEELNEDELDGITEEVNEDELDEVTEEFNEDELDGITEEVNEDELETNQREGEASDVDAIEMMEGETEPMMITN